MMKKISFLLICSFIASCSTSDLSNIQEEEPTQTINKESKTLQKGLLSKTGSVVMDLTFSKGLNPANGGCTFKVLHSNGSGSYDSTNSFGPNPISYHGYFVRGYGNPRTDAFYYEGVELNAKNKGKYILNRGNQELVNDPISNAISIEFPFQANVTYEIILSTYIKDIISSIKNDPYNTPMDDDYDVDESEAFPIIVAELRDTPEIPGDNPCAERPMAGSPFISSPNYYKELKAEYSKPPSYEYKDFVFYFSTKEQKNGLIIYFYPEITGRNPSHVPESDYTLDIKNIKVIEKPFDPAYLHVPTPNPNPCPGYRVCP
jgi:hypothetical protein